MLAFLVDQAQQVGDSLFQALWAKMGSKRRLWKKVLSLFECFHFPSFRRLYETLLDFQKIPLPNTS
ncbi:hypothetical protein FRUB_06851 [Fimbriiglobus ruber]|uniref:Uncharacterized protein n=2 Tax=Fimbriiglobus ruber TaxID=1908690 RepID=A0A225D845_9BACT|nr:hypothetical protein FRUB_06851 [Fimbriiglobus ruber]